MIQDLPIQNTFEQDGPKHTRNLVMDIEHAKMTFSHEMHKRTNTIREVCQKTITANASLLKNPATC